MVYFLTAKESTADTTSYLYASVLFLNFVRNIMRCGIEILWDLLVYFQTAKKPAADTLPYVLVFVLCFDMGSEDGVGYLGIFSDS